MSASALQMELVAEARKRRARLFGVPKSLRAIEAPAPQRLETDLPAVGHMLFGHHGVVHLFLLNR